MLKLYEVAYVSLDFLNGQVDEHTGDLGGFVFSGDLLNVLVDEFSYLTLIVRVLRYHSRQ
jgi:hypothetical protein